MTVEEARELDHYRRAHDGDACPEHCEVCRRFAATAERRGRPPIGPYDSLLSVRIQGPLHDAAIQVAAQRGVDVSVYVRGAIAAAVARDTKCR